MTEQTTPTTAATTDFETKRAEIRAKYAAKGAYIPGEETVASDAPVFFSASLEGLEGTGKTHLPIMTAPTPVVHINFGDRSAIPFLYRMSPERQKEVHIYDILPPTAEGWDFRSAVESLRELGEIIAAEGPLASGGTFSLDGGSSWWGTMQQVFVEPKEQARQAEGKKQVGGIIYEEANARARGIMSYLKNLGAFFFMTHQLKQDWDNQGPIPNRYSARRNSQVPYQVEAIIRMFKVCAICAAPSCENAQHIGRTFKSRLEKLSGNPGMEGAVLDNLDFATLYSLQVGKPYPGVILS